jgi:5-methylcytosine-specific restriction endonuclease McrA
MNQKKLEQRRIEKVNRLKSVYKKVCSKCGVEKPLDSFRFEKGRNQWRAECRNCTRMRIRRKFNQKSNKEQNQLRKDKAKWRANEILKNGLKKCNRCDETKELKDFTIQKSKGSYDGYRGFCKECEKIYWKNWRRKSSPWKLSTWKKWLANHPGRQQERWEADRKNEIKAEERRKKYYEDSIYREKILQRSRDNYKKKRAYMIAKKHKRESMMIGQNDGTVDIKIIEQILKERKSCVYCGKEFNGHPIELDHIDPLSKGGLHSKFNLVACCRQCNQLKKNKTFNEWLKFIPDERKQIVTKFYFNRKGRWPEQKYLGLKYVSA